jgi:prolyl-tRNA synthetase
MRYSQSFLRTTKETPKEAELISHQYLLRAGFVAPLGSGIYTMMPFGYRVAEKITQIILEELRAIGVEDIRMPVVHPARPWKDSGRFYEDIDVLWKIKNNSEEDFVLAMTGEEIVTDAAKKVISSYKDLPKLVGQIQVKVRDEARARGGLLRLREFMMQDAYSFDRNEAEQDVVYQKFIDAYKKIFERVGVETVVIESDAGAMGGSGAHEFMMIADSGEDKIISDGERAVNAEKVGISKEEELDSPAAQEKIKDFFGSKKVEFMRGIEVGNIFKLGTKYSAPQKLMYLDENNQQQPVIMGSYGIGVDRLIPSIIEASHDEKGMIWPPSVAPYAVHLISIGEDVTVQSAADMLYENLKIAGIEVFYDDRMVSAGEKFADADLLGFPYRLTVSQKTLAENSIELKRRGQNETQLIDTHKIVEALQEWM